jgi:hypothetical protein
MDGWLVGVLIFFWAASLVWAYLRGWGDAEMDVEVRYQKRRERMNGARRGLYIREE